jgi:hypothetical protein
MRKSLSIASAWAWSTPKLVGLCSSPDANRSVPSIFHLDELQGNIMEKDMEYNE